LQGDHGHAAEPRYVYLLGSQVAWLAKETERRMPLTGCTIRVLAVLAILTISCGGCTSHWPPAVETKAEIESLPTSQPDIRAIGIGDQELQLIAERFPRLNYLYLNSRSKISDRGISHLAKSSKLRQIVVQDGERISDRGIAVLSELPSLRELIITNAPSVTDVSLVALGKKKEMKILYFFKCPALSDSAKAELKRALPNCDAHFE
jgi:hypothetical protein